MLESNLKKDIVSLLKSSFSDAQKKGALPPHGIHSIDIEITIERTKNPEHGDICSTLPLRLAKPLKMSPMAIAKALIEEIHPPGNTIKEIVPAAPGFINFHISDEWYTDQVNEIIKSGHNFGNLSNGSGKTIQLEFGSNNPTGPLHVGHGRGAAVGDALARILKKAGYDLSTEYYVNDVGNQMNVLGRSTWLRYLELLGKGEEFPENHYRGEYIKDIAQIAIDQHGNEFLDKPEEECVPFFKELAKNNILEGIKKDLCEFRVTFDGWFSEQSLYNDNEVEGAIEWLRDKGHVYDKEGAVWLKSSAFNDDKDRVIIKQTGEKTYFCSDIAYHQNKIKTSSP